MLLHCPALPSLKSFTLDEIVEERAILENGHLPDEKRRVDVRGGDAMLVKIANCLGHSLVRLEKGKRRFENVILSNLLLHCLVNHKARACSR